jgi:DNA-binding FadR family transcriptional regulator
VALRAPQLYERIAEQLVEEFREGAYGAGDRLPPERELARILDVSRSSVREAIGALQLEGLVETRRGAGTFVAADVEERLRSRFVSSGGDVQVADASPFAVLQAREEIEPGIVRIAATRGQRSERIEQLLEEMETATDPTDPVQRATWSQADRMFHRELAVLTGNAVLVSLADQIAELMDQPLWRRLRDDMVAAPGRTTLQLAEHRVIYQNVIEGEAEPAAAQIVQHVQRIRRQMSD